MQVNIKNSVSMTENFSKVAKKVDETVVLKNNISRYAIFDYSKIQEDSMAEDQTVKNSGKKILSKPEAYENW